LRTDIKIVVETDVNAIYLHFIFLYNFGNMFNLPYSTRRNVNYPP